MALLMSRNRLGVASRLVAMYEVVLDDEGRHPVRVTDHPLRLGERLEVDALLWEVVDEEPSENPDVEARFVLRRVDLAKPTR
jgi:hypothetical protein